MNKRILFLTLFVFVESLAFTQNDLVDQACKYFNYNIETIQKSEIQKLMKEITMICANEGFDESIIKHRIINRLEKQAKSHLCYMGSKWNHPEVVSAITAGAIGLGFLGIIYLIYKVWYQPIGTEFNTISNDLKKYGISIEERSSTEFRGKHTISKNIIYYFASRSLSDEENTIVEMATDKLVDLRKKQEWIIGPMSLSAGAALISFFTSLNFASDIKDSNPEFHKKRFQKYQELLEMIKTIELE